MPRMTSGISAMIGLGAIAAIATAYAGAPPVRITKLENCSCAANPLNDTGMAILKYVAPIEETIVQLILDLELVGSIDVELHRGDGEIYLAEGLPVDVNGVVTVQIRASDDWSDSNIVVIFGGERWVWMQNPLNGSSILDCPCPSSP